MTNPTQAMILAAGRGKRMHPLTLDTPKPLLCVGGKPLIVWHIDRLRRAGIRRIVVNAGHLGEKIVQFFANSDFADVVVSFEDPPLETAGGIKKALDKGLLHHAPFVLINGDVWTDSPLTVLTQHDLGDHLGFLLLTDNPDHHPMGDFGLTAGLVCHSQTKKYTFCGLSVLSPALVDELPSDMPAPLAPLLSKAIAQGTITGARLDGAWVDVGTPARLFALDEKLNKNFSKNT